MWWKAVCTSAGLLGLAATGAGAAGFGLPATSIDAGTTIQRVHSVDDVEEKLYRNGYYDIRLERATLPYSFSACKRGTRYHVHVNYYGDFVQVDAEGPCGRYGYRDDDGVAGIMAETTIGGVTDLRANKPFNLLAAMAM